MRQKEAPRHVLCWEGNFVYRNIPKTTRGQLACATVMFFDETLEKFNINVNITHNVTIQTIKDINKPIIILFHWYEYANEGVHYALIDEFYKDDYGAYKFRVINYSFDKQIHIITERELKSMLFPYEIDNCKMPVIWY